jgi:hypothetical protein
VAVDDEFAVAVGAGGVAAGGSETGGFGAGCVAAAGFGCGVGMVLLFGSGVAVETGFVVAGEFTPGGRGLNSVAGFALAPVGFTAAAFDADGFVDVGVVELAFAGVRVLGSASAGVSSAGSGDGDTSASGDSPVRRRRDLRASGRVRGDIQIRERRR